MARSVNKVILIGNLGQDPELRYTGSGTAVCNMRIATNESYRDASGNMVDKTEWHNVVAWSRLAEICGEYLKKGSQVYFEGSLQTRSWDDRDGNTRYTTEIKAREMMILNGRGEGMEGGGGGQRSSTSGGGNYNGGGGHNQQPQRQQKRPQQQQQSGGGDFGTFGPDDDLPF